MAVVEVKDFVLWTKHIHGDAALRDRLLALAAGEVVRLVVDDFAGVWSKMEDGKNGVPTPGLKPIGPAQARWRELYRERRGELVEIREPGEARKTVLRKTSEPGDHYSLACEGGALGLPVDGVGP